MKTVLETIIESRNINFNGNKFLEWFDRNKEELLEKEKQQIIDACKHGSNYDKSPYKNAEEYFDKTFEKK